jgi:hypothetical protein
VTRFAPVCACRPALYHVKGSSAANTCAVQVATSASSLNSGDVFVLSAPSAVYVWAGAAANGQEKAFGRAAADM